MGTASTDKYSNANDDRPVNSVSLPVNITIKHITIAISSLVGLMNNMLIVPCVSCYMLSPMNTQSMAPAMQLMIVKVASAVPLYLMNGNHSSISGASSSSNCIWIVLWLY